MGLSTAPQLRFLKRQGGRATQAANSEHEVGGAAEPAASAQSLAFGCVLLELGVWLAQNAQYAFGPVLYYTLLHESAAYLRGLELGKFYSKDEMVPITAESPRLGSDKLSLHSEDASCMRRPTDPEQQVCSCCATAGARASAERRSGSGGHRRVGVRLRRRFAGREAAGRAGCRRRCGG